MIKRKLLCKTDLLYIQEDTIKYRRNLIKKYLCASPWIKIKPKDIEAAVDKIEAQLKRGITMARPKKRLACKAVIYHGPGHQSKSQCELTYPHRQHNNSLFDYYWSGDKAFSTDSNESPEENGE